MAARPSMIYLIEKVRDLIDDDAGADQEFSDERIEEALDQGREEFIRTQMIPSTTVFEGGDTQYLTFYAEQGYWEEDVTIQDGNYKTLTGITTPVSIVTSDYVKGRWTTNVHQAPPLYLSGYCYDIYGAAVLMLEQWYAKIKHDYDFLSAGRTFKRSQQMESFQSLIAMYQRKAKMRVSYFIRSDMNVQVH